MNDVPALFFEGVVFLFFFKSDLSCGSALSGRLGHFASEAYAKRFRQYMRVTNGQLANEKIVCEFNPSNLERPCRRKLLYTGIDIRAGIEEYSTDPEAMERLLSATKEKHVLLNLRTPNISEEIAKCVQSIQFVFYLHVETKITSDVLKVMRSLVEKNTLKKNTLNKISITNDVEIEDETTQLLVDLLKQKQFYRICLHGKCSAALKEIISSWEENSEEMVGKMVYCREGFAELKRSKTEFPFEECTEEEERDFKRFYPFARQWSMTTTKMVLRKQDGRAVYCGLRPSLLLKTVFVFA